MAPRGGKSGSSYGSDSYYDDYDYESSNPWLRTSYFGGYADPYLIASVVFNGVFLFGLLGIAIFGFNVKSRNRNSEVVKTVLAFPRWGLAVIFGLIYYAFTLAASIMQAVGAYVANLYFIIQVILYSVSYIADILLLFTVFTLLSHCLNRRGEDQKRSLKRNVFLAHAAFCAILGAIYISFLGLQIDKVVKSINDSLGLLYRYYDGIPAANKVDVAFSALYFVASFEVLLATIYLLVTAQKRGLSASLGLILVALVGFPLFLRWIFILSYAAAFELSYLNRITLGGALAEQIIIGFAHLIVYAGVVLVAQKLPTGAPWEAGQGVGSHAPPMMSANPNYTYPQQQQQQQQYPQKYSQSPYPPQPIPAPQHGQQQVYYPRQSVAQSPQQQYYPQHPSSPSQAQSISTQSPPPQQQQQQRYPQYPSQAPSVSTQSSPPQQQQQQYSTPYPAQQPISTQQAQQLP
ncbi:hypothetical protein ACLMJK_008891 [Lecanora helva]